MELKAIIFDFDGTLAELNLDFGLMKERIVKLSLSRGLSPRASGNIHTLELLSSLASGLPIGQREDFLDQGHSLIREMELQAAANSELFPFTRPLLSRLAGLGVSTAIVTRNLGTAVKRVFPDIEAHVTAFVPREEVERVKPDPAHLFEALKRMGNTPAETLYVGDHPIDVATGKRAGVKTCAVLTGRVGKEEFLDHGPDYILEDCRGVLDILGGSLQRG